MVISPTPQESSIYLETELCQSGAFPKSMLPPKKILTPDQGTNKFGGVTLVKVELISLFHGLFIICLF